jgi:hypothetical protein
VADAVVALVQAPAGSRPLRTSVPAGSPAATINDLVAPIQRAAVEGFGLGNLLPKSHATA